MPPRKVIFRLTARILTSHQLASPHCSDLWSLAEKGCLCKIHPSEWIFMKYAWFLFQQVILWVKARHSLPSKTVSFNTQTAVFATQLALGLQSHLSEGPQICIFFTGSDSPGRRESLDSQSRNSSLAYSRNTSLQSRNSSLEHGTPSIREGSSPFRPLPENGPALGENISGAGSPPDNGVLQNPGIENLAFAESVPFAGQATAQIVRIPPSYPFHK